MSDERPCAECPILGLPEGDRGVWPGLVASAMVRLATQPDGRIGTWYDLGRADAEEFPGNYAAAQCLDRNLAAVRTHAAGAQS